MDGGFGTTPPLGAATDGMRTPGSLKQRRKRHRISQYPAFRGFPGVFWCISHSIRLINAAKPSWTHKYVSLHAERAVVSANPSGETTVGTWAGAPAWRARPPSWSVRPPVHARSAVRRRNQTLARDSGVRFRSSGTIPSPLRRGKSAAEHIGRFLPFLRSFCLVQCVDTFSFTLVL